MSQQSTPSRHARLRRTLYLWAMMCLPACSSLDLNPLDRTKPLAQADDEHPVIEVICLWQPGEGQGLDGLPSRGFAGQVLFFARGHKEPVLGNGDVSIYVFDDVGDVDERQKPVHIFNFPKEVWQTYSRESSLGAAYQIFVPYTRSGTHTAECQIKVKFNPPAGRPIFSRDCQVLLSGTRRKQPVQKTSPPELQAVHGSTPATASGVVPASYEVPVAESLSLRPQAPLPSTAKLEDLLNQAAPVER